MNRPDIGIPEGYIGDPLGSEPRPDVMQGRSYWDCWFGNLAAYPRLAGGGSGNNQRITIEGLDDFNRTLRALGSLIKDIAVSLGVEINIHDFFSEDGPVETSARKNPLEAMETELDSLREALANKQLEALKLREELLAVKGK